MAARKRPFLHFANDRSQRIALFVAVGVASTMLLQFEAGRLLLYPFTILATWFHEMGHGIVALLTGGECERLVIFADGSGYAQSLRPADSSRVADALVAAGGPMGPAIAGAVLIMASRKPHATRNVLGALGAALIASTAIWVRSLAGWIVLPAMGCILLAIAVRASPSWQRFVIQLFGVQACFSVWSQFDYLFSSEANVVGGLKLSDTGAIAEILFLPYWFWGAAMSIATAVLLWSSLKFALRR